MRAADEKVSIIMDMLQFSEAQLQQDELNEQTRNNNEMQRYKYQQEEEIKQQKEQEIKNEKHQEAQRKILEMEEANRLAVIEAAYKTEERVKTNLKAKEAKKNKRLSNSNNNDFIDDQPQASQQASDFFHQFEDQNLINDASQDADAFKTPDAHSQADSLANLDNEIANEMEGDDAERKLKKKKKKDKNDPDRLRKKEEKKKKKQLKKMKMEEEGIPSQE